MTKDKTNVMRFLDQKQVSYMPRAYDVSDGVLDGRTAAERLQLPPEECFKTLVTQGASKRYYVFVIPVGRALDTKKAAKAAGEKAVEMIPQAELLPVTGYVHGGCSPLGMKKPFRTFVDASAQGLSQMTVSAGKIGRQVTLAPVDLVKLVKGEFRAVSKGA